MIKTKLYVFASMAFFMATLFASESMLEHQDACSQLNEQTGQLAHPTLPLVLQQFVCHEDMPGLSKNVILKLTQTQYKLYDRLIKELSHVSVIIINEEPSSAHATQGSEASVASTVIVVLSEDSLLETETQPFKSES